MSKIIVVPKDVTNRSEFISRVRSVTKQGMAEILKCIDDKSPLVEWELFLNNHDDVAMNLKALLAIADDGVGELLLYELMPDEAFADCPVDQCEITAEILRGILDKHDDERAQLDRQ